MAESFLAEHGTEWKTANRQRSEACGQQPPSGGGGREIGRIRMDRHRVL